MLNEAAFERQGGELFEEQRIAFGRLDYAPTLVALQNLPAEPLQEQFRLVRQKRVEGDAVDISSVLEEGGVLLEKLLPRHAGDEDRPLALVREVLEEIEEGRFRPVQVVEDQHERPVARQHLAQ